MRTYVLPFPGQEMPKGDNRRRGVVGPSVYMRMLRRRGSNPLNSRDVFEACSLMCTCRCPAYTGTSPMYTSSPPDCSAPSPPATARLRDGSGPGFSPQHGRCGPFAGRVSCRSCAVNRRRSDPSHEPESRATAIPGPPSVRKDRRGPVRTQTGLTVGSRPGRAPRTCPAAGLVPSTAEISRARDRAELVTDDAAELRTQLQEATGERIAALEGIGEMKCEAADGTEGAGRGRGFCPTKPPGKVQARNETLQRRCEGAGYADPRTRPGRHGPRSLTPRPGLDGRMTKTCRAGVRSAVQGMAPRTARP